MKIVALLHTRWPLTFSLTNIALPTRQPKSCHHDHYVWESMFHYYDRHWEKINAHFVVSILQLHHLKMKELSSFATHSKKIGQFYSTTVVLILSKMWMYCKMSDGHLRLRVIFGVDHIEVRLIPSELISTKNVSWSSYNTTFWCVIRSVRSISSYAMEIPSSFSPHSKGMVQF